jgi:hypothetical protein
MAACPARVIALLAADRRREYLLRLPQIPSALGPSKASSRTGFPFFGLQRGTRAPPSFSRQLALTPYLRALRSDAIRAGPTLPTPHALAPALGTCGRRSRGARASARCRVGLWRRGRAAAAWRRSRGAWWSRRRASRGRPLRAPSEQGRGRRSHGRRHLAPNQALPLHAPRPTSRPRCRWRKKSTRRSSSPPPWTPGGKVAPPRREREGAGHEHDGSAPPPAAGAPRRACTPTAGRSPEPPPTRCARPSIRRRAPPRELRSPWSFSSVSRPARRGRSAREEEEVGAEEGERARLVLRSGAGG